MLQLPTAKGRKRSGQGGLITTFNDATEIGSGLRGIISALAIDVNSQLLAAGTFSRNVAMYDTRGQGAEVACFSLNNSSSSMHVRDGKSTAKQSGSGSGVTQLHFLSSNSASSPYLLITERSSDGISVYDLRSVSQDPLAYLTGRNALTNQRLAVDVGTNPTTGSPEVYAGGTDGFVRVWEHVGMEEGIVQPERVWEASNSGKVIGALAAHPLGAGVVVTGSGSRSQVEYDEDDESENDNNDNGHDNVDEKGITIGDERALEHKGRAQSRSSTSGADDSEASVINEDSDDVDADPGTKQAEIRQGSDCSMKVWAI